MIGFPPISSYYTLLETMVLRTLKPLLWTERRISNHDRRYRRLQVSVRMRGVVLLSEDLSTRKIPIRTYTTLKERLPLVMKCSLYQTLRFSIEARFCGIPLIFMVSWYSPARKQRFA